MMASGAIGTVLFHFQTVQGAGRSNIVMIFLQLALHGRSIIRARLVQVGEGGCRFVNGAIMTR